MSIDLLTQPGSGTPTTNIDYTNQNLLINGSITAPGASILTDWTSTAAAPAIAQGSYIYHANNLYKVTSSDYAISGTPSAGLNYIKLSISGTNLTAAWVTTFAGYTYSETQNGWYSGTDQILFNGDYLVGSTHNRYLAVNKLSPYQVILGDGRFLIDNKNIVNIGGSILTGGGVIDSEGGQIQSGGANISSEGGDIDSASGDITSGGGKIDSEGGIINTNGGRLLTGAGEIISSAEIYTTADVRSASADIRAPNGHAQVKVYSTVPTGGRDGDIALYESGTDRRIYCRLSGTWRSTVVT